MIISYKDKKTPLIRNYSSPASLMTTCEKGIKKRPGGKTAGPLSNEQAIEGYFIGVTFSIIRPLADTVNDGLL